MPYIQRDENGKITALHACAQANAREELPLDHPEVLAFLLPDMKSDATQELLAESDRQLSRVIEDLITLLAEQNIIRLTDLPHEAQRKLLMRKNLRKHLSDSAQLLIEDDELL